MKMKRVLFLITTMLFCINQAGKAQMPAVTLKTIDGKTVRTDTLSNNGKPIIIDFFATWCKPCNRELKAINEVYEDWQEETGVKLIAVSIDQKAAPWKSYLAARPGTGNVLEWHAVDKKFSEAYRVSGTPRFILIDKDFKVRVAFAYKPGMQQLPLLDQVARE